MRQCQRVIRGQQCPRVYTPDQPGWYVYSGVTSTSCPGDLSVVLCPEHRSDPDNERTTT